MAQSRYVARLLPEARPTASAVARSIMAASTPRPHVEMPGALDDGRDHIDIGTMPMC